jgi:hypothetical protein
MNIFNTIINLTNVKIIRGLRPLKPLQENTIQENAILFHKQDIQGKFPLKPLNYQY